MMFGTVLLTLTLFFVCCCWISFDFIPHVVAAQHISATTPDSLKMLDNVKQKDGIGKLFGLSGYTSSHFANMTVTYPDKSVHVSSVPITDNGSFQSFVVLNQNDPSGLYHIDIYPYNGSSSSSRAVPLSAVFFLADYDGLLDIRIPRNAVIGCSNNSDDADTNSNILKHCMEPGISHTVNSFDVRFFNNDYDTHQIRVGTLTTDLILPGGDAVLNLQNDGKFEYYCVIHPWIKGLLHVSDIPAIKPHSNVIYPDITFQYPKPHETVRTGDTPATPSKHYDYDASCSMCYIGTVTKILDGDTIYVNDKSVRLSLVNTPEKRQSGYNAATKFVSDTCPVGSKVLVDVDDILLSDYRGVNFAQITCSGDININEHLINNGLAKMYDSSCTESEFMHAPWTKHDCSKLDDLIPDLVQIIPNDLSNVTNSTGINDTNNINDTSTNNTTIQNIDTQIVYIIVPCIIMCIALFAYLKKNQTRQNVSFTNIEYLD